MKKPSYKSINDKINNLAKKLNIKDVNKLTILVTLERVVARLLTRNFLRENLIFSGGFVMFKTFESNRFTLDLDAIITKVSTKELSTEIEFALRSDIGDGFVFWGLKDEKLDMKSGYTGVRFSFHYKTGELPDDFDKPNFYPRVHLDIVIDSDRVISPRKSEFESALDLYGPLSWSIYPPEYIIADKLHATFSRLGESTRAKDIYDLSLLLPQITDVAELMRAVEYIFKVLDTEVPASFYYELMSYSPETFERVWRSAVDFKSPVSFKDSWSTVLEHLKRIDNLRESKR
ncbi:MAG: nucleotidyl transferase AbiEii/AbiGii toxin family protein [Bacteriovoracaceae bacterium]